MSTIASPRDPSGQFPRRTNSVITPTSSSRPSLDVPASASNSPNPNQSTGSISQSNKRANRAALREYYNLRGNSSSNNNKPLPSTPTVEITDHPGSASSPSLPSATRPPSELDLPNFDAEAYVANLLATSSLTDLLRTYTSVLGEMRALDAERKALVYDNYSKLIAATETIRRMRGGAQTAAGAAGAAADSASSSTSSSSSSSAIGAGVGAASLEAVVEGIYRRAADLREELRASVAAQTSAETSRGGSRTGGEADEKAARRERTKELAREVVKVPGRVRKLVEEGKVEEAKKEWEMPRRLLVRWKELGVGGDDVPTLIEEGDAALREAAETDGNKGGGEPTS
ncbi:hypothetical protein VTH82DRAFT_6414 [Thermothelomyces myriococcoides]